jgi:hypothetical protein
VHLEYGMYMSEFAVLNPVETSQVTLGSLLPLDLPRQVTWHMRGLIRNGGTMDQLKYALDITSEICRELKVDLLAEIPPLSAATG